MRIRLKRDEKLLPGSVEGEGAAGWVVLDYLDCVLHVFTPEARERYRLEELWHEAPRLELDLAGAPARHTRRAPDARPRASRTGVRFARRGRN